MTLEEWYTAWQEANPCKNPGDVSYYYSSQDVWNAAHADGNAEGRAEALKEAIAVAMEISTNVRVDQLDMTAQHYASSAIARALRTKQATCAAFARAIEAKLK